MTGMLASVNCIEEAMLVLNAEVDIIDLKQPASGALGALDTKLISEIVEKIGGVRPVSATIGDLPMAPEPVYNAVMEMTATGVDYIKIGFFPGGKWMQTLSRLADAACQGHGLIAVLFADTLPDFSIIDALAESGFRGVMLDTADKQKGSLTTLMPDTGISEFIDTAKRNGLLCGLAGSLRREDISGLILSQPDYLGFRGALCEQQRRTARLNRNAVLEIKTAIAFHDNEIILAPGNSDAAALA